MCGSTRCSLLQASDCIQQCYRNYRTCWRSLRSSEYHRIFHLVSSPNRPINSLCFCRLICSIDVYAVSFKPRPLCLPYHLYAESVAGSTHSGDEWHLIWLWAKQPNVQMNASQRHGNVIIAASPCYKLFTVNRSDVISACNFQWVHEMNV
jgi:hypothetical protein